MELSGAVTKIDANVEAYRAAAQGLRRLRAFVRDALQLSLGASWQERGIPEPVRDHLRQRRERETAVSWHLPEGADSLDYAGFADLLEIVNCNPELLDRFLSFVPDGSMLRTRFLELDVLLARIAYARVVSESELEFLVSFFEKVRPLLDGVAPSKPAAPSEAPAIQKAASPDTETPTSTGGSPAAEPRQVTQRRTAEPPASLAEALRNGDKTKILTALYHEVTTSAESLWKFGSTTEPAVWSAVRESAWYQTNFSALGLKALSDFYDLLQRAREHGGAEGSAEEVREYLRATNFAQLLMALRELFKQHLV